MNLELTQGKDGSPPPLPGHFRGQAADRQGSVAKGGVKGGTASARRLRDRARVCACSHEAVADSASAVFAHVVPGGEAGLVGEESSALGR